MVGAPHPILWNHGTMTMLSDLERLPHDPTGTLRAWDAADELLLEHLALDAAGPGATVVVNDGWGALACGLAPRCPVVITDSYVSRRAIAANLGRSGVAPAEVAVIGSFDPPPTNISTLVVKIPRTLALLEDQLRRLRPSLAPGAHVVAGAMTRHLHTSTIEAFERLIGPVRTFPARRKARLLVADLDEAMALPPDPWPAMSVLVPGENAGEQGISVVQHAGVFSADGRDGGTRLMLEHLPTPREGATVVDLGCGNGIVGTAVARLAPTSEVVFVDESDRAVESARSTVHATLGDGCPTRFLVGDGLSQFEDGGEIGDGSVDLVLNNPPFHRQHATGDATAWQMFADAHRVLRTGGELWVVGNRHLNYHAKLRRRFGNCEVVASNPRYVLLRATRTGR